MYDNLYRLSAEQNGAAPATTLRSYGYNQTGDRLSITAASQTTTYAYQAGSHRLTSIDGSNRSVDANVNLTHREDGAQFEFNARNRMSDAVIPSQGGLQAGAGGTKAGIMVYEYSHNGRGERNEVHLNGMQFSTIFGYDETGHLLGSYVTTGGTPTPQQEYIYLNGMPVAVIANGQVYYIGSDHLGTPRKVVDPATNTAVWAWNPLGDAFGADTPNEDPDGDGTAFTLNLRFPGQYYDSESGLHYNYFRYYDSSSGRYTKSDPLGLGGGMNTYTYSENEPLSNADPDGLEAVAYMARHPTVPYNYNFSKCQQKALREFAASITPGVGLAYGLYQFSRNGEGVSEAFDAAAVTLGVAANVVGHVADASYEDAKALRRSGMYRKKMQISVLEGNIAKGTSKFLKLGGKALGYVGIAFAVEDMRSAWEKCGCKNRPD